jgi:hypothetical protein
LPAVELVEDMWDGSYYGQSILRAQRWADLQRDQRVTIVVNDGSDYLELRGVEIFGSVEFVGEQPRKGEPHQELAAMEPQFFSKYFNTTEVVHDGNTRRLRMRRTIYLPDTPALSFSLPGYRFPWSPPGGSHHRTTHSRPG